MNTLTLQHIGKIDAVGSVQVFGYSALRIDAHFEQLVYLNYAGPATAADAVWARLVERKALDYTDLHGRAHRLHVGSYPGLQGNEAPFKRFVTRIEHLATDHTILLDKRLFMPDYDADNGLTFVFDGEHLADKVGQHINQCVNIPVFPDWHPSLLALGRRSRLILPLHNYGGHPVYQVTLDRAHWTQLIALAVEQQELTWPGEAPAESARQLLSAPIPEPEPEQPARSAPINRYWAPPKVQPASLFLNALMTARAQATRTGWQASKSQGATAMIQTAAHLAAMIREHIAYKDFWETPNLQEQLQARLTVFLDDRAILPYDQLGPVVDHLMALARQHQADLLEPIPSPRESAPQKTSSVPTSKYETRETKQPAQDIPAGAGRQASTAHISFKLTHDGDWTWLTFEHRPDDGVLSRLKSAGFRWGKKRRAWYTRTTLEQDTIERLLT